MTETTYLSEILVLICTAILWLNPWHIPTVIDLNPKHGIVQKSSGVTSALLDIFSKTRWKLWKRFFTQLKRYLTFFLHGRDITTCYISNREMLKFVYRYHTVRNEQEFHIDYLSKLPQFTVYLKNWIASIFLAPNFW